MAISSNPPIRVVQVDSSEEPVDAASVQGAVDDEVYADATGAADGTVISLLKGIYVQLAIIADNTTPA